MDLIEQLKAFVATAQSGSFTEAAERLGISNRLTSKYVGALEKQVGARLLQRTTRKVGLTTTGVQLLTRAPALLEELDDMLNQVSQESKGLCGLIRITAPQTLGEIYIKDLLVRFLAQHPQLSIDLRLNDDFVDLASEGFDLAFRVGEPDIASLKVRRLGKLNSHIVASPEYLQRHGTPKTIAELANHTCIIDTNRRDNTRWTLIKDGQTVSVILPRKLMVNSALIAKAWAVNGCGIAYCPGFALENELANQTLIPILPDYQTPSFPICAAYLSGNVLAKKVRALIDFAVLDIKGQWFLVDATQSATQNA